MDVESVKSGNSYRSHQNNASNKVYSPNFDPNKMYNNNNNNQINMIMTNNSNNNPIYPQQNIIPVGYNSGYYPPQIPGNYIYPVQNHSNNYVPVSVFQNSGYGDITQNMPQMTQFNGEKIQVQILPQDDNWGGAETCTAITSDTGGSCEDVMIMSGMNQQLSGGRNGNHTRSTCARALGNIIFVLLCVVGVFSPVAMVVAPQLPIVGWKTAICTTACEGLLLGMACKLIVLAGGSWALFFRPQRRFSGPHICLWRLGVILLAFGIIIMYWLLFCLRVLREPQSADFLSVVQFATSLTDSLLLVHYLALVVLEIRRLKTRFYVKIIRSPDGETRLYELGLITLQQTALEVLQKYVGDFPEYNYELAQCLQKRCTKRHNKQHGSTNDKPRYKVYNVDSMTDNQQTTPVTNSVADKEQELSSPGHKSNSNNSSGTSARLYEETEWEKKFRKRQMRLLVAVEEALSHVRQSDESHATLGALEAAQTILPAVMKPLQKLLRASRRQLAFSSTTVTEMLAHCLNFHLSARFLVKQLSPNLSVLDSLKLSQQQSEDNSTAFNNNNNIQLEWVVLSNCSLSRSIFDGLVFQLKPRHCKIDQLSLFCTVYSVPFFSIHQDKFDSSRCKFILQTNSETSV